MLKGNLPEYFTIPRCLEILVMLFHFVTDGYQQYKMHDDKLERRQSVATLGTFTPVKLEDLRRYVRQFPLAWVTA